MILLIGSEGSMGKRYQAILNHLGKKFLCCDTALSGRQNQGQAEASAVIIATPTETHARIIRNWIPFRVPVLCEKPITKNLRELKELMGEIRDSKTQFRMMNQYRQIVPKMSKGESSYNYFRHGNDGLIWDCIQIIGLSDSNPDLKETSPIWDCRINGTKLHIEYMDAAYVMEVQEFLAGHPQDLDFLYKMHQKTWELANDGN